MKVAIVGAGGLVGNEFARYLSPHHDVCSLRHPDLDITDSDAVSNVILNECPELIINCAVLGVDASEADPSLAWSVNVAGAENLAQAANAVDAEFVQLSSNYVFDGERSRDSPYTVQDRPAPINTYGQTKLVGERAVSAAAPRCFIVRTSWVFGTGKKNFFSTAPRSLRAGQKVRAITDVWASSTYVRDLVQRVMDIVSLRHYATYHVVNSGNCSYYEFALEVARILGNSESELTTLIEPVKLDDLRLHAKRPVYSPMVCRVSKDVGLAPLRDWRAALAEYVGTGF
ncbi:MAG: dTDP-4-dehydrorhamnose reductase [Pyrinomonadaceae bacterium]